MVLRSALLELLEKEEAAGDKEYLPLLLTVQKSMLLL